MASNYTIGTGSHLVTFHHPQVGTLNVLTGIDEIEWSYVLNTANFPTYGGEVIQILSCMIDNLTVGGTLQTYEDMETLYGYFVGYLQVATQGRTGPSGRAKGNTAYNQEPMTFRYHERGWEFTIFPLSVPGFRKARDLTVPEWRLVAHVSDEAADAESLKEWIVGEVELRHRFGESFGFEGKIGFIDENPFSDPNTRAGKAYDKGDDEILKALSDHYSKVIPAYLEHDFDGLFGNIGSKPSFARKRSETPPASRDTDNKQTEAADRAIKGRG